jgi:hypothetical protein
MLDHSSSGSTISLRTLRSTADATGNSSGATPDLISTGPIKIAV